ncbi:MAG: hypothetical protein OEQ53_09220, partial [Saprospiraceae bacterium]|nr:hypothetical protein [Saprospiraceae bacterium]
SMLEDREGNIWFGTSAGVSRFDGSHFTHYTSEEGLSSDNVWCMLEDTHGNLWFGTQGGGVSRYDGSFIHFTTKEGLSNNNIWSMLEDSNGDLWFGTNGGGVNRYDGITFTHYTTEEGLNNNQVWSMLEDREGNIWFGTRGSGVNRYDGTDFTHYTMEEGLSNNRVWSILEDKQGKLWFGTRGGGVNRFDFRSFSHYTTAQGLSNNEVGAILEDTNGGLWFGTELGVNYFDGSSFTHYTSKEGLIGNTVNTILEGSHGDVWFGTSLGLSRFDGTSFFPYTTNEGLGHNNVQSSSKDSQGNLWFGTVGGGVSRYDGNHFTHYSTKEGLSHNTIRSILEDRRGNIWFGTQGGGASRFDGTSFVHYTTAEGLGNNLVWCIFEDSQGHLWFGTQGGGVSRYDGNSFTNYTTKEGLSHNWVWSLLEDENKNIWISTEDGITVLSPSVDSISVANSTTIGDYQAFTFGKADGLRRLDFSQSACIDRNNHIWWGSTDGLTMLNLNHFALPSDPPQIRLNIIEVSQTYVDYRRLTDSDYRLSFEFGPALFESYDSVVAFRNYPTTMTLPYNIKHLTFGFSAIDWAAPHKLQYSYLMEGLDKNWSPLSFENKVDYRNLVPGTYRLKLKAFGAAQVWSDPFDYSFSIYPPWWLSWWAKLLYIISGLWLIISFVRWRTASFKQRHIELEKTVAERTAEVLAQTAEAVAQRNRSEELLLNILPAEVAEELKETGRTQPMHFEEVSILFADFKEFTNIVASIPGKKLVEELDDMFQYFDDIIDSEGLEKIQTVGDAYVAAGGLPKKIPDHALRCVQAAKKMMDYLERRNEHSAIKWRLRVGIHSGPITAGVVGKKKFSYDIFGDTVNIAARIESSSEAGRINVSAYTYDLIRNNYTCEYRGKINAKGKGDLDMYFVN